MNMIQAIRSGLEVMLERDPNVCVFGEDVGYFGGVFRATQGLQQRFGLQAPESPGRALGVHEAQRRGAKGAPWRGSWRGSMSRTAGAMRFVLHLPESAPGFSS